MADPTERTEPTEVIPEHTGADGDHEGDHEGGQRRRRSDGLIVALNDSVQAMSTKLTEMGEKLEGFTTTGEVNKKVAELEARLKFRTFVLAIAVVVLAGSFAWYSNYKANQSTRQQFAALAQSRHQAQLESCNQNNTQNQVLRDVVDRSQQQQIDPAAFASLSPAAKEILQEFARLQSTGGAAASFRQFVYELTPITNCLAKYPPPPSSKTKPKPKSSTSTTTKHRTPTTRPTTSSA
jgi:hypothetical protein